MSSIIQDLRYAARRLAKDRRFTLAAVAALALGIGATSAVFTLVNAVLLRTLPFDEPHRVMWLNTRDAQGREFGVSEPDFDDWRAATRTFSGIALMQMGNINISADDRAPDQYDAVYISSNGFSLIGSQPLVGREFSAEDDRPGAPPVVLLSYSVWQSRYGGDRSIIGRAIRANSEPATIVGVMPPGMEFPFTTKVWLPISQRSTAQTRAGRESRLLMAYGRLADGMTIEQARTEMSSITATSGGSVSRHEQGHHRCCEPLRRADDRPGGSRALLVADGRGGLRSSDRLRERGESSTCPRLRSFARDGRPHLDRRHPMAPRPAAAGRERAARLRQWTGRSGARVCRHSMVRREHAKHRQALLDGVHYGRQRRGLLRRHLPRDGRRVRPRAGAVRVAHERHRSDERRRARGFRGHARAALDDRADCGRAGAYARAAFGRGAHDSQLHEPVSHGHRRRHVAAGGHVS